MPVELRVPSVGESITEVEIGEWMKKEGDSVTVDEPVAIIETEKVTVDLPAPVSGNVTKILKKTGEKAKVGDIIGYIEQSSPPAGNGKQPAETSTLAPAPPPAAPAPPAKVEQPAESPAEKAIPMSADRQEEAVPMTHIRRRIAERLVAAQRNAALLTTFNQIDMSGVITLRNAHQEGFREKHGVKLGFMSFFVKAAVAALKRIPQLNAEIRGETIVYHNYYDIGIAIGADKGLVVPVLRNAERLSFPEIEKAIVDLAERARGNQLKVDELQGGTFTISNGGVYGSLLSTPIVNPPQSGVLGLHVIEDRPVVYKGEIVARPMMYVALTYDHRIVDGKEAVTFLKHIKELVEDPARLLLDV